MATKKATATINATANNTTTVKPIAMHTVADVHELFVKAIGTAPIKCNFSDAKQSYTGTTDFSVNFKRSMYAVYMSADNVKACMAIDNTLTPAAAAHDTKSGARDYRIDFSADKYDTLKKCIDSVIAAAVKRVNAATTAKKPVEKPAKAKKPTVKKSAPAEKPTAKKSVEKPAPAEKPAAVTA